MSELSPESYAARERQKKAASLAWREFRNDPDYAKKCPRGMPFAGRNNSSQRAQVPGGKFERGKGSRREPPLTA